jgi:neutral trehalase
VSAANRPTDKDYDLFVYLVEQMRDLDWDQKRYLRSAPLQVEDVLFNSILCRANRDLATIAEVIGEDPTEPATWLEQTGQAINDRLWDEAEGTYFSFDRVAGRLLKDDTIAGFFPMYGRLASRQQIERLVEVRLLNPKIYWPESGYPVPTTAMDSNWFNPQNYWLGPVWVNTNWMLGHGLADAGHMDLAAALTRKTADLILTSGFREYYDPRTGQGYGTDAFSWTAALTIDLVAAMNRG